MLFAAMDFLRQLIGRRGNQFKKTTQVLKFAITKLNIDQ